MDHKRHLTGAPGRAAWMLLVVASLAACVGPPGGDPGSRTLGTIIDDERLETRVARAIREADEGLAQSRVVVRSHERRILLAGEVPSAQLKSLAETRARAVRLVEQVHNELVISGSPTLLSRTNDRYITNKVNTQMLASDAMDSDHVKVTTVNGVVYLLGRVSRAEAEVASQVTREVGGVEKVVTLFEYLD